MKLKFGQLVLLSTVFVSLIAVFNIYLLITTEPSNNSNNDNINHGDGGVTIYGNDNGDNDNGDNDIGNDNGRKGIVNDGETFYELESYRHCFDWNMQDLLSMPSNNNNNNNMDDDDKGEKEKKEVCYNVNVEEGDINPCFDVDGNRVCLPYFIIIGFPKTGTSSLYYWLSKHHNIQTPIVKETDFFEHWIDEGKKMDYYAGLFPTIEPGSFNVTYEATTKYATSLLAPKRIKQILPKVRLIAIVRDPIEQLYSDYLMTVAWCKEPRQIENGVRLPKAFEEWIRGPVYTTECFQKKGGCDPWIPDVCRECRRLGNSIYADWLKEWLEVFSADQLLVLRTEDLKSQPLNVMKKVERFLGLKEHDWGQTLDTVVNVGGGQDTRGIYQTSSKDQLQKFGTSSYLRNVLHFQTREYLANFYHPHNQRLINLLGWSKDTISDWIKPRSIEELENDLIFQHCFNYTNMANGITRPSKEVCYTIGLSEKYGWNPCFDVDGNRECMAHYIIIGWPKCGTSSLYYYNQDHPYVEKCMVKETDFFEYWLVHSNPKERLGHQYYASLFPSVLPPHVTGEATTKYSMDLQVPARIKETLPFARLIVVFRNPPDQIYSNYLMTIRWITKHNSDPESKKKYSLPPPFDMFVDQGKQCFTTKPKKCDVSYSEKENRPKGKSLKHLINWARDTPAGDSLNWDKEACTYSCPRLGETIYVDYMETWLSYFPRDQFLVVKTQDLEKAGSEVMKEFDHHLYLPQHDYSKVLSEVVNTKYVPDIYNVTKKENLDKQLREKDSIPPQTRSWLTQFYYPHNMRLEDLLQVEMKWDPSPIFSDDDK